ncbi:MAG: adenylyl-sulfate kinase [Oscillospiraceae bacterium]|nr:adenylyl-sulfate kinase [Oscillospiraceae bacterium]
MKTHTFWLMGLPSSGKTTLASAVRDEFELTHLDSDEMRKFLTPSPMFAQGEREFVYRGIIYTCHQLNKNGINVIISATANLEKYRDLASEMLTNLKWIHIECPIEICEKRDDKKLYVKSREGLFTTVPIKIIGQNDEHISKHYKEVDVFEYPEKVDFSINTATLGLIESTNVLREYIKKILTVN